MHAQFMQRAIELSAQARYHAPPNPWVGCVLVRDNQVVGEGFTQPPGSDHAEIQALKKAGELARGATAYVTLEPCSHFGRTPPCTHALIRAGVSKVFASIEDPDTKVKGKGLAELRCAGIDVEAGLLSDQVTKSLTPYLHHRSTGLPYCVVKAAITADGRMAAQDGSSQWITCEAARADAHRLRAQSQAIVIGSGTAIKDSPSLTVRHFDAIGIKQPLRVVLDTKSRLERKGSLFDETAPTWIVTQNDCGGENGIDLLSLLQQLGQKGVVQVLVEGGPKLLTSFWRENLINQLSLYIGPRLLGNTGKPLFDLCFPNIASAPQMRLIDTQMLGSSVRLDYQV
ncbi:MAG: bifunctional diaminohydroxyphosphoribosylaminopyrimidine deaminase/5-amino-6-(5-phosphoribosylamino)uracil reductase RibD [Chlamydiales bacterium]|nr:bifunctional diaminohydroxyphosphoribosylaminopyrimidine deaminase/5-amino-6-(5-phosphoribosylamino)uracil reductase RibD [Chlamydiales bacterium]